MYTSLSLKNAPRKYSILQTLRKLSINQKTLLLVTLKPPLPLPSRPENKKDKCSHLVIWTSTMSIIRIQQLFVISNYFFSISQTKKLAKDEVCDNFPRQLNFFSDGKSL